MAENKSQPVHNPHDKFAREAFTRLDTARELLRTHLPQGVVKSIDWRSLSLVPRSFVDERLKERCSDLLYSVKLRGQPILLYVLLEHQSTVDPDMPFRLLLYMVRIWEDWLQRARPGTKPPCIVPIVLHQGVKRWTVSTRFQDWLGMPEDFRPELARLQPDFEHVLIDLSQMSVEEMGAELELRLVLSLMKAAREGQLERWLAQFGTALGELLGHRNKATMFRLLMQYAFAVEGEPPSTVEQFVAKIEDQRVREGVMSIAEQLISRGRQEGEEQGLERGRQEGRQEGRIEGQIQLCQQMLGLPVMSDQQLEQRGPSKLKTLLRELQSRLRQRMNRSF